MDMLSIIGVIAAVGLMIFGMSDSGGNLMQLINFYDVPSIAITVGGTFASLMIMFPLKVFAALPKMLIKIFKPQQFNLRDSVTEIVGIAHDARKNGLLSLEENLSDYKDEFLRKGIQLVIDSTDPESLREIMEAELGFMMERHKAGVSFFEKGATLAPGFGMLGTLVGLINMLATMDDPDNLTRGMSIALVTTFYGSVLANIIFLPMGNKLQKRSDEEVLCRQIAIEGIVAVVNRENPNQIREKLISYIPPSMRGTDKIKNKIKIN